MKFTGERLIPEFNQGQAFFYEHILRYFLVCEQAKNKTVLDAGCGSGYGSYLISKYGQPKSIESIDISKETINYAKSKFSQPNINFHIDNILELKTIKDNSIDLAISFEVIEHITQQEQFLNQIKRVLNQDGIFIVSTPNILNHSKGNKYHFKELKPKEFQNLLEKYFKNVKILTQSYYISQEINSSNYQSKENINLKTKQTFFKQNTINFKESKKIDNCEYLLAICSDKNIPNIDPVSISLDKVDNFNLTKGIRSLNNQFNEIKDQNGNLKHELEIIKSSKFFKLWRSYNEIKDKLKIK